MVVVVLGEGDAVPAPHRAGLADADCPDCRTTAIVVASPDAPKRPAPQDQVGSGVVGDELGDHVSLGDGVGVVVSLGVPEGDVVTLADGLAVADAGVGEQEVVGVALAAALLPAVTGSCDPSATPGAALPLVPPGGPLPVAPDEAIELVGAMTWWPTWCMTTKATMATPAAAETASSGRSQPAAGPSQPRPDRARECFGRP